MRVVNVDTSENVIHIVEHPITRPKGDLQKMIVLIVDLQLLCRHVIRDVGEDGAGAFEEDLDEDVVN